MTYRDRLIDYLARLVADGVITEAEAARIISYYDAGEVEEFELPLAPDELPVDDDHTAEIIAALLLLLNRSEIASIPQTAQLAVINQVQDEFERIVRGLAGRYSTGLLSLPTWQTEMLSAMRQHTMQQMMVGSRRTVLSPGQLTRLEEIMRSEAAFLSRFADQIAAQGIEGALMSEAQIANRAALYGGVGRGEAFRWAEDAGAQTGYVVDYVSRDDIRTCLLPNQRVLTRDGWVEVKDIHPGEMVLTGSGYYSPVVKVWTKKTTRAVELQTSYGTLRVTEDHPILIERQGHLQWCEAGKVLSGDTVFFHKDAQPSKFAILNDRTFRQSLNQETGIQRALSFGRIAFFNFWIFMPIITIGLYQQIQCWQKKIKNVFTNCVLLYKFYLQKFKSVTDSAFESAFIRSATGLSVAGEAAIPSRTRLTLKGSYAKSFAALLAGLYDRWSAAFFGAIMPCLVALSCKRFATSFANQIGGGRTTTRHRAGIVSVGCGTGDLKFFSANTTYLGDASSLVAAFSRTMLLSPFAIALRLKQLATYGTLKHWGRSGIVFPSKFGGTGRAAIVLPSQTGDTELSFGGTATINTGQNGVIHDLIVPHYIISCNIKHNILGIKRLTLDTKVYDLTLQDEHTFYAENVLVHNCSSCISAQMNGPYLSGRGPFPGQVCFGRSRCRCYRRLRYDPVMYQLLGGI